MDGTFNLVYADALGGQMVLITPWRHTAGGLWLASFAACAADGPEMVPLAEQPVETIVPTDLPSDEPARPAAAANHGRDIVETALSLDLASLQGRAAITLAPSVNLGASFDVGDLHIVSVEDGVGPLSYRLTGSQLDVGVPESDVPTQVIVSWRFERHRAYAGWMPAHGVTFLWPYFCGNLYPCHPDPADGQRFTLEVTGVPAGKTAVYPTWIPTDAPAYMPAIAIGDFTKLDLGFTSVGTAVHAWHLPGQAEAAARGTAHLRGVFDFLERTYGQYAFGPDVGSVSANWEPDPTGGMEHHPYWHIGKDDFDNEEVHAHEAAHGWFGNGVRIACWEDFVLSEGTTSYISARALESQGVDVWPEFECLLKYGCNPNQPENTIALLDTCGEIDLLHHPLWSTVPYMKGAYFYKAVAEVLGVDELDAVIAAFYADHVGEAARMSDMLDALKAAAGARAPEIQALEDAWLRAEACPVDYKALCKAP